MPSAVRPQLCWPLTKMDIRFDGVGSPGGLLTVNGARFGMVRNGGTRPHQGVDLFAEVGTTVYAIADGRIVRVRHHDPSYGQEVILEFLPNDQIASYLHLPRGSMLYILYAHLSLISVGLGPVRRGQGIGATGISGNADQRYPHLHFEVRTKKDAGFGLQHRIDPERIFPGINYIKPFEALDQLNRTA